MLWELPSTVVRIVYSSIRVVLHHYGGNLWLLEKLPSRSRKNFDSVGDTASRIGLDLREDRNRGLGFAFSFRLIDPQVADRSAGVEALVMPRAIVNDLSGLGFYQVVTNLSRTEQIASGDPVMLGTGV